MGIRACSAATLRGAEKELFVYPLFNIRLNVNGRLSKSSTVDGKPSAETLARALDGSKDLRQPLVISLSVRQGTSSIR